MARSFALFVLSIVVALCAMTACATKDDQASDWPPPAPPEGHGMQFKVGPFDIAPGTEIHKCVTYQMEESMLINRIESFSSDKTHHFAADVTIVKVPDGTFDCREIWTSEVMANSLTVYSTDRIHNRIDFPEGVAGKLPARF